MLKIARCLLRCLLLGGVFLGVTLDWCCSVLLPGRFGDRERHSQILHRWSRWTCRILGCNVRFVGERPTRGMCVSNHVSYLDIPVHASAGSVLLVSKRDVLHWPIFGQLAWMCGTIFINREKRGDVAGVGRQMETVMKQGVPVVVFPEGTSADGRGVLPFKSSLFQPAIDHQWPVTPMWIGYELPGRSVDSEVAYHGDMTLLPHLLKLFMRSGLRAVVVYGEAIEPGPDRKELCRKSHEAVVALSERGRKWIAG